MARVTFLTLESGTWPSPSGSPQRVDFHISATWICSDSRAIGWTNPSLRRIYENYPQSTCNVGSCYSASYGLSMMPMCIHTILKSLSYLSCITLSELELIYATSYGLSFFLKFCSSYSFYPSLLLVSCIRALSPLPISLDDWFI